MAKLVLLYLFTRKKEWFKYQLCNRGIKNDCKESAGYGFCGFHDRIILKTAVFFVRCSPATRNVRCTHPLECLGTSSVHFPCIEIRRVARPPQKGQNGRLAVRPGWRPSGVIAEARNARPSIPDMPWLGFARLPPSRSPRSIRPPRSVGAVERASEAKWRFFRRRASAQPVRLSPSQGKPPPSLS